MIRLASFFLLLTNFTTTNNNKKKISLFNDLFEFHIKCGIKDHRITKKKQENVQRLLILLFLRF